MILVIKSKAFHVNEYFLHRGDLPANPTSHHAPTPTHAANPYTKSTPTHSTPPTASYQMQFQILTTSVLAKLKLE